LYTAFTDEQNEIIYSDSTNIYVDAKAGTGKTTTLSEFAKIRRYDTFLYLVYNASMRSAAKNKFTPNVNIHTIHSLAFQMYGHKFKDRLVHNLKVEHVFSSLDYFTDKIMSNSEDYNLAYEILQVVSNYCNSEVKEIEHFNKLINDLSIEYWQLLSNENGSVKVSHDVYLKLFFLSDPILDYDFIIVDEAQDLNKVAKAIIKKQKSNKVYIGDRDQKIYGFRGAINIFEDMESDSVEFSLSKSFRFGNKIADVANLLLSEFKDTESLKIVGSENIKSTINEFDFSEPYTLISRTNADLIENAIKEVNKGNKIHIVGGFEEIKFNALNIYHLYKNQKDKITSDFLKKLKNFHHFVVLAEQTGNPEYKLMISFVERYGDFLADYINLIDCNNTSEKLADVTLVTAHKSKGLEFYNVVLSNDFVELYKGTNKNKVEEEEINLIYVAITRAIETLVLNKDLNQLLKLR